MSAESKPKHEVFISYSSKDKKWADTACAVLEKHRIRCWVAPRDITPGYEWAEAIIKGLNSSRIMVLIFSADANASPQVRKEVERAIGKGLPVLPFRVENVLPEGAMELNLSNTHWLDGFTPPVERQLEFLAKSVKALLAKEPDQPPEPVDPPVIAPGPSLPDARLLIGAALAVLLVIIVAGSFAMFSNRALRPEVETAVLKDSPALLKADTAPRSDQERVQGRWRTVERITGSDAAKGGADTKRRANALSFVWQFQGKHLTIKNSDSDREWHGSFSLSPGVERKLFDFVGRTPLGEPVEFLGIYEFQGEFINLCYCIRRDPNDSTLRRPDTFAALPGTHRVYQRFKRQEDR